MVKKIIPFTFALSAIFFLCGCATLYNSATGRNEVIFINSASETAIGQSMLPQLTDKHPVLQDSVSQARLQSVGRRLAQVSDRKDIDYKFSILTDKELNAVALPGGFIYINKGLFDVINDDQLAYVMGHEVGHVAARHIVKKLQANMAYDALLGIVFAGLGSKAGDNAKTVAQGVDMAFSLVELGYSREDEYEADRLGAKYAYNAGFDPYAALSALDVIKKVEGQGQKAPIYLRSHPYVDDRINALKNYIPQLIRKIK